MDGNKKRLKPVTASERRKMIEIAAYFHAQLAKFQGSPAEHWQTATTQVDDLIRKMNRWKPGGYR